jgi:hypothetical protein
MLEVRSCHVNHGVEHLLGCTLQQPADQAQKQQEQPPPAEPEPQQAPPEQQQEEQKTEGAELGMGAGLRQRDVMDLIKVFPVHTAPAWHVY